jgi:hypothetical protein
MFFWDIAIPGLSVGLSLLEGAFSASANREQAELQAESIKREMELLNKQKDELSYMYRVKGENVRDQFGNQMSSLLDRVQSSVLKTEETKRDSVQRSGLQYSGTIERKANIATDSQRRSNVKGQRSLLSGFQSNMLDLTMAQTREVGQIDQRLAGLEGQLKAAETASDEYFLGIF